MATLIESMLVSMASVYEVERYLTSTVMSSPRKYDTWRNIISEFKPKHTVTRYWIGECVDELIRGWVNSSPEITALLDLKVLPCERLSVAYRSGIHHALMEGEWPAEYRTMAILYDQEQGEEQDGV